MKNKNYFTRYLILVLPLLFINLNAQEEVDALEAARLAKSAAEKAQAEADAATEAAMQAAVEKAAAKARVDAVQAKKDAEAKKLAEAKAAEEAELDALAKAAGEEAKRKIAQELGLDDGSSEGEASVEEAENTETNPEEVEVAAEVAEEAEELAVKESSGYNVGLSGSMGFIQGGFFDNIPIGGSLVISTPWGFDVAGIRFGLSGTIGAYPAKHNSGEKFTPIAMGVGGNLTLAKLVFAEGHVGLVGEATGARGFAGISLERLMKKGLNLPFNVLIGGEGFMSTRLRYDSATYWGGLAFRLDMSF